MNATDWDTWIQRASWELTECVCLSLGEDPKRQRHRNYPEFKDRLETLRRAVDCGEIERAILAIPPTLRPPSFVTWALGVNWKLPDELDVLIDIAEVSSWGGFDPESPHYPPELAIALKAWREVSSQDPRIPGKALKVWLKEHYAKELSDRAIDRIATICNWRKDGGR